VPPPRRARARGHRADSVARTDLLRNINDPEHPLTLEQLHVAQLHLVSVDNANSRIKVWRASARAASAS
jgi:hypothetical protein